MILVACARIMRRNALESNFWGIKINENERREREREKVWFTHVYRVLEHHDWARTVSVARRTWQLLAGNQSSWSPRCGVFMEARGNRLETHKGKKFTSKFIRFRAELGEITFFNFWLLSECCLLLLCSSLFFCFFLKLEYICQGLVI